MSDINNLTKQHLAGAPKKRVAILVVHGIGRQVIPPQHQPDKRMYSQGLYQKIQSYLLKSSIDLTQNTAWIEANYAHVFNNVQTNYYARLGQQIKRSRVRQLVVENLGDAATYRPQLQEAGRTDTVFARVQGAISLALKRLEIECVPDAPLIVLAHSLGGQVMMDYFQTRGPHSQTAFERAQNLKRFITFGCNIPLFLLGQEPDTIAAISHPSDLRANVLLPWWLNFYDRDDVLGYPLIPTGVGFEALGETGQLRDIQINAGNLLTRWNTLSHMAYWNNQILAKQVAGDVMGALKKDR